MADEEKIAHLEKRVKELEEIVEGYHRLFRVFGEFTRRVGGPNLSPDDARVRLQAAMEGKVVSAPPSSLSSPIASSAASISNLMGRALEEGRMHESDIKALMLLLRHGYLSVDVFHEQARNHLAARARDAMVHGNLISAQEIYGYLAALYPDNPQFKLREGDCEARLGNKALACAAYENVAAVYVAQGFFLKAVAVMKQMLKIDPERTETRRALGRLYENLGLSIEAALIDEEAARRLVLSHPEDNGLKLTLAEHYFTCGREADALPLFLACFDTSPVHDPSLLARIALCYERLGQIGRAIEAYGELLKLQKDDAASLIGLVLDPAEKIAELKRRR